MPALGRLVGKGNHPSPLLTKAKAVSREEILCVWVFLKERLGFHTIEGAVFHFSCVHWDMPI